MNTIKNMINEVLKIVLATITSIIIASCYYTQNILSLKDNYKEFIFGDTVYANYSKEVDINVIFIFLVTFLINYFVIEMLVKKRIIKFCYMFFEKYVRPKKIIILRLLGITLFSYLSSLVLKGFIFNWFDINLDYRKIYIVLFSCSIIFTKSYGIYISQIFMPLIYHKLLINRYMFNGNEYVFENNLSLKSLVIVLVISSVLFSFYEIRKNEKTILLSTVIFFGFLLSWTNIPLIYNLDEYHTGELFTAYHQVFEMKNKIYSDYIPVKGFYHILIGLFNKTFYDGGYISIYKASILNNFFGAIIICILFSKVFTRELLIILLLLNILPFSGSYYLIPIIILVLLKDKIYNDNYNFVITYLYLMFIYFLYYQGFGIALAASLFPIFMYKIYQILKERKKPNKKQITLIVLGIIMFFFCINIIYFGLKYSLLNSGSNLFYWGNSSGYLESKKLKFLIKMMVKNSWVYIVLASILYIIKKRDKIKNKEVMVLSFTILYPLIINSYLLGRHDNILSRTATYSVVLWKFLLLYILYKYRQNKKIKYLLITMTSILVMLGENFSDFYPNNLNLIKNKIRGAEIHHIGSNYKVVSEDLKNLNLGNGFIEVSRYDDLLNEFKLFNHFLKEDETFLLMDNYVTQSARYSIFNKKIPTLSHSVLQISSPTSQGIELKRLREMKVPIVRVSPGLRRYYLLYKYLLDQDYVYTKYSGRNYLIERNRFTELQNYSNLKEIKFPKDDYSDKDFGVLPIKWGHGFNRNKENIESLINNFKLSEVNDIIMKNKLSFIKNDYDPFLIYSLEEKVNGKDIDFIKVKVTSSKSKIFRGQIYWKEKGKYFNENQSVLYSLRNGYLIIPIGKNISWRESKDIKNIRFDFMDIEIGNHIKVEEIEFLKYKDF